MNIISVIHEGEIKRYTSGNIPPLLMRMKKGGITRSELKLVIERRYQVAHFFEDWLRLIISIIYDSKLPSQEKKSLAFAAEKNLQEELGESDYGGPHKNGREVQLSALGIAPVDFGSYSNPTNIHSASLELIEGMRSIVSKGPIEAIAALWYYENRISLDGHEGDYHILLGAMELAYPEFKKHDYNEGDVLHHIASHAEHDEFHALLAEQALEKICEPDIDEKIKSTCEKAQMIIDNFWNTVLD